MGDGPRTTQRRTVGLDYGQLTLVGGLFEDGWDSSPLLEQAVDAPVAGDGQLLLVLSPHQNNFELELTVEVWDAEPPADADDWQQVVRGWLEVEGDLLRYESPTMDVHDFDVPSGRYAVEVSGRGFVNYGCPGSTTPGDVWRVRLWPSDVEQPAYAVRTWTDPGADVDPSGVVDVGEEDWADWDPGPMPTGIAVAGDGSVVQLYEGEEPDVSLRERMRARGGWSESDPHTLDPRAVVDEPGGEVRWDGPPVAELRALLLRTGTPEDQIDDILRNQGVPEDLIEADHLAMPELGISGDLGAPRTGAVRFVASSGPAPDEATRTGSAEIVSGDGEHDAAFLSFATYEEAQAAIEAAARRFSERDVEPPEPLGEA